MRSARAVGAAVVLLAGVALAGCTGGSDGTDTGPTSSGGPSTVTFTRTASATTSPTGSATGSPTTGNSSPDGSTPPAASTPVPTASVAQPPDPVVEPPNVAAWTLTRAAPGTPASRQLAEVQCGQDGSVSAAGLALSAGGVSLSLSTPPVTVTGTAELDAAGGTFRGRNADTAVTFTWTC